MNFSIHMNLKKKPWSFELDLRHLLFMNLKQKLEEEKKKRNINK